MVDRSHGSSVSVASRADWLLLVALAVALIGLTVVGADDYRRYEAGRVRQRMQEGVQVGDSVPPLHAQQLGGGPASIDSRGHADETVIYVTRSGCQWSERNLQNLRSLMAATRKRVVILSLDDDEAATKALAEHMNLNAPIYFRPTADAVRAYGLGATPVTMGISARGVVQEVLRGAYIARLQSEAEKYFGVTLPGVAPVDGSSSRPGEGK